MDYRPVGTTGLKVSAIGFGAFKIGRNQQTKYCQPYDQPTDEQVERLLRGLVAAGVTYADTAPAYGASEARLGRVLGPQPGVVMSTKVGETFENGQSAFDFSAAAIRASINRSRERIGRQALDLVFVHSDGNDAPILKKTEAVATLKALKSEGLVRAIGFSGKTAEGARAALDWANAIMVEYHVNDQSHRAVMAEASRRGVAVMVKKGLASGRLPARQSIEFVLRNHAVTSMVIGGLNLEHMLDNIRIANDVVSRPK